MTRILRSEPLRLREEQDLLTLRRLVREGATESGFGLLDLTKIVTAASELGRNALVHGGGGTMLLETIADDQRRGVRLTFEDKGPGIADIEQAMTDGFSTGRSLGLGLGGSRRLVDEFEIASTPGAGTRVTVMRWT